MRDIDWDELRAYIRHSRMTPEDVVEACKRWLYPVHVRLVPESKDPRQLHFPWTEGNGQELRPHGS